MTKEEAIENIKLIRFNAAITNANSFKEALDIAIEALSQPSLPEKYQTPDWLFEELMQPEADLEKEIKRYQEHYILVKEKGFYLDWMDIETTARHFYELGRAAKEHPALPSNIDEAAEEIVKDWLAYGDGEYKKLVKAGVEWMAGQFQKIEGELVDWYETNGVDYCHGINTNESFEVPEGFYIRKKQ